MITDDKGVNILIVRNGWKFAKVFAGHEPIFTTELTEKGTKQIPLRRHIEIISADTSENLVKELEFYKNQGGPFLMAFASSTSGLNNSPNVVAVSYQLPEPQIMGQTVLQGQQPDNLTKLRAEIKAEVLAEIRQAKIEEEKEAEIEAMRQELAEMKTEGGKLAYVLREMAKPYIAQFMTVVNTGPAAQPLQGQPEPQQPNQQQPIPYTEEGLNLALGKLVREFGAKAIIDLANDDNKVNTLKTFI